MKTLMDLPNDQVRDCKEITLRSLLDPQDSFSFPELWSYRNPVFLWISAILIQIGYLKELSSNTILPWWTVEIKSKENPNWNFGPLSTYKYMLSSITKASHEKQHLKDL